MLAAIFLLSGGLVLVRARSNPTGSLLWLAVKLPPDGAVMHVALPTDGEPGRDGFANVSFVPTGGTLSMSVRFLRREGDRVELGVKARYEPEFGGAGLEGLKDIAQQNLWIEPRRNAEIPVQGLGAIQFAGDFVDHNPSLFDPKANEFRIVSPLLIRGKKVIFKQLGVSGSTGDAVKGLWIYSPGEGRFLFSPAPFKGAIQGSVFDSRIEFSLDRQEYLFFTAVPVTRATHVWVKHDPRYKPSEHNAGERDDVSSLGSGDSNDFPKE
jgi:hypothetical protein